MQWGRVLDYVVCRHSTVQAVLRRDHPNSSLQQSWVFVRIPLTDESIRALCAKALAADESDAAAILAELRMALREHNEYLRALALEVLNHSSSKAAD